MDSMELAGSTYLYTLAALSMAFVAFSTIAIVVRLAMGATLSKGHFLLIHLYLELGFMATAFSMLPMLLASLGLAHTEVWRISGGISLIPSLWWMLVYPRRHHAATTRPMPTFVLVEYFIGWLVVTYGIFNVVGYPHEPYIGPYAVAATWTLVLAALMFLLTVDTFLRPNEARESHDRTKQT